MVAKEKVRKPAEGLGREVALGFLVGGQSSDTAKSNYNLQYFLNKAVLWM